MDEGPIWFAPRRYGIGIGRPIAWQGWAVLSAFALVIGIAFWIFGPRSPKAAVLVVPAVAALILVMIRTTRGGWRWRWGGRE